MLEVSPYEFALVWSTARPPRERDVMPPEGADGRGGGPGPLKRAKEEPDGILDLPVGIEDNAVILRITKAHGQVELQGRPAGFVQNAALQARAQDIEFGLTHGPFESEEEAIIEGGRVVQAIFIEDEGAGQGADFQQTMPVAGA